MLTVPSGSQMEMTRAPDVVIVGAGSAGCALAARLSERPSRTVLLLDAGADPDPLPGQVADASSLPGRSEPWVRRYPAQLGSGRDGALVRGDLVRGVIVGGSSAVNGGYFIRGTRADFDGWAAAGNDLWSFDSVLPTFVRLERDLDLGAGPVHGDSGPVPVTRQPDEPLHASTAAFFAACEAAGHVAEPDKNADSAPGFGLVPRNVVDGRRVSSAAAYLDPARDRPNLEVRAGVSAVRVVIEDGRAIGVEVRGADGALRTVAAGHVVLCSGAIGSAQLLLVSGIGPAPQLESRGVDVLVDSPGVGSAVSNHPSLDLFYAPVDRTDPSGSFLQGALHAELRVDDSGTTAPVEILATRRSYGRVTGDDPNAELLSLRLSTMRPSGRGTLRLRSGDALADPAIELDYLRHGGDRAALRALVRHGARLLDSAEFAPVVERRLGPDRGEAADDRRLDEWIETNLTTSMHLSGSAPMGPAGDPRSVVDQRCGVHGVAGLSVVDTSIMPTLTSRGPAATAIMIAEHASRFFD